VQPVRRKLTNRNAVNVPGLMTNTTSKSKDSQ
jgi:hypothetical protein